jgi:hypothetical protein
MRPDPSLYQIRSGLALAAQPKRWEGTMETATVVIDVLQMQLGGQIARLGLELGVVLIQRLPAASRRSQKRWPPRHGKRAANMPPNSRCTRIRPVCHALGTAKAAPEYLGVWPRKQAGSAREAL